MTDSNAVEKTWREAPSPALKTELANLMIEYVQRTYTQGCMKVAKITVQVDFKDGQMIGFERKAI